jgi:hypothetical protein
VQRSSECILIGGESTLSYFKIESNTTTLRFHNYNVNQGPLEKALSISKGIDRQSKAFKVKEFVLLTMTFMTLE